MKQAVVLLAAVAMFSTAASGRTYMGHAVKEVPFTLAGGQVVSLPVTDAGPIPAENDLVKIEVAGFSFQPTGDSAKTSGLVWNFAFSTKKRLTLEAVTVEEVAPDTVSVELVKDANPSLTKGLWDGDSAPRPLTMASTPWLFESGTSVFVFKLTIKAKDLEPVILYQPSGFSHESKLTILKILRATAR